ncbi:MAG: RNA polymerase sigma factor [Planctomycetota bacterium]|jgi:DNA-directed RNA polymerase specialized sigma24 family protein
MPKPTDLSEDVSTQNPESRTSSAFSPPPDDKKRDTQKGKAASASNDRQRADRKVVEGCLAGDERAWEQLYRRCHPRLVKAIELLLGTEADNVHLVEEIEARVWFALLRNDGQLLATYDASRDSPLDAFLMGLARIEIMRHARSERRRHSHELVGGRRRLEALRVSDWQLASLMEEFTSTLTPGEREFLESHLTAAYEESQSQEPSNLSASNVWQRRHRIRFKLEGFLKDLQ